MAISYRTAKFISTNILQFSAQPPNLILANISSYIVLLLWICSNRAHTHVAMRPCPFDSSYRRNLQHGGKFSRGSIFCRSVFQRHRNYGGYGGWCPLYFLTVNYTGLYKFLPNDLPTLLYSLIISRNQEAKQSPN